MLNTGIVWVFLDTVIAAARHYRMKEASPEDGQGRPKGAKRGEIEKMSDAKELTKR